MAKPIYHLYGIIENGGIKHYNWNLFHQIIADLEGKEFDLVIKEKYKKVSLDTHGYYRGGIIKEALKYEMFGGWSDDDLHNFFADMFLKYTKMLFIKHENGLVSQAPISITQSTSSLSQSEMNEFVDKVIRWLSAEGIVIHSPEQYFLGRYKSEEEK